MCSARRSAWSADALGIELDEVRCDAEYAETTEDLDLGSWTIPAGGVAGVFASWQGIVDGRSPVVEINVRWRKGQTLVPDWKIEQDGWVIEVAGRPTVTMKVGFLPPPDFEATTLEEFMVLGHIMTATPAAERHPAVVAAAPGIVTYNDLPLILPRGVVAPRLTSAPLLGIPAAELLAQRPVVSSLSGPCDERYIA